MRLTPEQFEEIYTETARPLKAYLLRLVQNPALADELLQETYYRFLRSGMEAEPFAEGNPRTYRGYLFRVASNLAHDLFRGKRETGAELNDVPAPAANYAGDVDKVLGQLKPRERELVWLAYAEGASHREIAEALGCKEASVRPMLHRARQRLAGLLKSLGLHERMMV